jgi:hypothetical protein
MKIWNPGNSAGPWPGGNDSGQEFTRVNPYLLPVPAKDDSMLWVERFNPELIRYLQEDAKRLVEDSGRGGWPFAQNDVRLYRSVCPF